MRARLRRSYPNRRGRVLLARLREDSAARGSRMLPRGHWSVVRRPLPIVIDRASSSN